MPTAHGTMEMRQPRNGKKWLKMTKMMLRAVTAMAQIKPFFACHCTSGSSFLTTSGTIERNQKYERTSISVRSLAGGAPPAGGGGGGGGGMAPGGGVEGGTVGGMSLIASPSRSFSSSASILAAFAERREAFLGDDERRHRQQQRKCDSGHDGNQSRGARTLDVQCEPHDVCHHRPSHQQH